MSENMKSYRRPILVASTVLLLGGGASLALNIKAISLTPGAEWGAYASGIGWPLALLLAIELLIHTPWAKSRMDTWIKVGVLVLVAGVAAWISYWHGAHVLSHWGYDEVGRYAGPLVPDAAMALATLALQRVAEAKRVAKAAVATVAKPTLANHVVATIETLASGQHVAAEDVMATPVGQEADLATDWADLEGDLDRELAEMTAAGQAAPPATEPEPAPAAEATEDAQDEAPAVRLTTVPALAAKRIQEALDANASTAELTALDAALADEGLAGSPRTARRWRAAVANRTARVS
jgi:hypothetical protein